VQERRCVQPDAQGDFRQTLIAYFHNDVYGGIIFFYGFWYTCLCMDDLNFIARVIAAADASPRQSG